MQRSGGGMFADAPAIQRIFARAGGEGFGERDPIRSTSAVLHQSANITFRLTSEDDSESAIGEAADGALETIWGDFLPTKLFLGRFPSFLET
jgi:hypothetical protein